MRRLILQIGISLDGFCAALDGSHPWGGEPEDGAQRRRKLEWVSEAGAHVMGRKTYEEMASFWPTSQHEYAAPMNEIPKVVFSKTLTEATWPVTEIARGDLAQEIARLKREPGNDLIAYGGAAFARSLIELGLIDEYRFTIQAAALGSGMPIFTGLSAPLHLDLVEAHAYPTGTAIHVYRPRASIQRPLS
jgi:dihydrofolate reductase